MIYGLTVQDILTGVLVFLRIGAILFALPFFGDNPTPVQVRILLAVALTLALYPLIPQPWVAKFPDDMVGYFLLVIRELCIGISIGFIGRMAFDGILMAASVAGYQMGFSVSDLFMPDEQVQMNAFTALHRVIMISIFLALNLHMMYIETIIKTFQIIPAGGALPSKAFGEAMIGMSGGILVVAMQLAAPLLVALLFSNTALGLVARVVPQFNVFSASFQVGFFVGMTVYICCLPFFPSWLMQHMESSRTQILATIKGIAP